MADLRDKRIELVLQQLQQLPTLPAVAVRVLEVTGRDESSARHVVEIIESDQSLTAKVLGMLRRAERGISGDVVTVERAVVLLGFEEIRNAVLALSVFGVFEGNEPYSGRFDREGFWKHSLAVACCAQMLAEEVLAGSGGEAFVCGLLHDIGKVALDAVLPKSFERIVEGADLLHGNIADLERSVIGIDHMIVGKRLAERWGLPGAVRDCIWLHGQAPEALPPSVQSAQLVNIVTLADVLAREQHLGYSGNYTFPAFRPALEKAVGVPAGALQRISKELIGRMERHAEVLGLGRASSGELYFSALTSAHKELGRVGQQLEAKNRRLAVRAKYFDALAQFQGELRPDSPPGLVLQAIAQTAGGVLNVAAVAAFSAPAGGKFAETVIVDGEGNVVGTGVVENAECRILNAERRGEEKSKGKVEGAEGLSSSSLPTPQGGPVLPCGDEMEWLMGEISPRLGGEALHWIALEAEGACIGGVVWGGKAGEAQRLGGLAQELAGLAAGWGLALRTAQIRDEAHTLAEQLAETNRKLQDAQAEVMRSKMLATVGEMAAGAAHEMNNPLAVISGRSQLLASQLTDPKLKQAAATVAEQAHQLSQIITDMMAFARPEAAVARMTDVAVLVDGALREVRGEQEMGGRRVELTLAEVPAVRVDPKQVRDALAEVLRNAVQATDGEKGRIGIHAGFDAMSGRVVVSVTDNGRGMEAETLKRAFDPFYSNLPAGRRRGMGLAKALRWVEGSGGTMRLESRVGEGTRATILLPAMGAGAEKEEGRRAAEG